MALKIPAKGGTVLRKGKGLRRRWLINTAGTICALGMVCVVLVTVLFGDYYYSAMESDMRLRAETSADFLANDVNQSYDEAYLSCCTYAQTFENRNIEVQFIDTFGDMVASSYEIEEDQFAATDDITDAISTGQIQRLPVFVHQYPPPEFLTLLARS